MALLHATTTQLHQAYQGPVVISLSISIVVFKSPLSLSLSSSLFLCLLLLLFQSSGMMSNTHVLQLHALTLLEGARICAL